MRTVIVIMLVAVLGALAGAGFLMLRRGGDDRDKRNASMANALALRVGLSIALFLFVLLAWSLGWIRPTGLPISA